MNVIIVGGGKLGYRLASALCDEDNDIVVIDIDETTLEKISDNLDVMCIKGNGVSLNVLNEAGISTCDVIIAVTASDEVNMVCSLMSKKLGAKYTVARIRELYYNEEIYLLKEELELDVVINPEEAAAQVIAKKLQYSFAVFVESFGNGRADLVEIRIDEKSVLKNRSLMDISAKVYSRVLIAAVSRGKETIVPDGGFIVKENDSIYILGTHDCIREFYKKCGIFTDAKTKTVMIVGGGKIALYLTELIKSAGIKAKVIERDIEKGQKFAHQITNGIVIQGDGTDEELLVSENIEEMDAFVALTGHDEDNLMSSLLALEHKVPKIIAKITRPNYTHIVKKLGINSVVSPMIITANRILKFMRMLRGSDGRYIESLYKILGETVEIIEYRINPSFAYKNIPLKDLDTPKGLLVGVIMRGKDLIIPNGSSTIRPGDNIILITNRPIDTDLNSVFGDGGLYESQNYN